MKKGAHVVLVGNTSWGMYNFRKDLIHFLIEEGYRVSVVAPFDKEYSDKIIETGSDYYSVSIDNKGINPIWDLKLLLNLIKIYKKLKPDFIFHYTIKPVIYGSFASGFLRIQQVPVITGLGYAFLANNFITKIVSILYRVALKSAKQVWFLNSDDQQLFVKKNIIKNRQGFVLKGEGINTDLFKPGDKRTTHTISFLLAARILSDKGIYEYAEAARIIKKRYSEVQFNLLGFIGVNNPTAIPLETVLDWQREGIINYLGSTDNIIPYIESATCIVLPSYREGLSRILLEAASLSKPIIATNITGCKEIVEDGFNGYLCEVKDIHSLSEKIEKVINMSVDDTISMGERGRQKIVREFDQKIINRIYKNILDIA